jgi:hypothetical protein
MRSGWRLSGKQWRSPHYRHEKEQDRDSKVPESVQIDTVSAAETGVSVSSIPMPNSAQDPLRPFLNSYFMGNAKRSSGGGHGLPRHQRSGRGATRPHGYPFTAAVDSNPLFDYSFEKNGARAALLKCGGLARPRSCRRKKGTTVLPSARPSASAQSAQVCRSTIFQPTTLKVPDPNPTI